MQTAHLLVGPLVTAVLALGAAAGEPPVVIHETADPFGGPFGLWGMDVFVQQSAAARFTPDADYDLHGIGIWFMNNSGSVHPSVTISLQTDGSNEQSPSVPSGVILEQWEINIAALGWNPMLDEVVTSLAPRLDAGAHYWIVAESSAPPAVDAVWNFASEGNDYTAGRDPSAGTDWFGGPGAALAFVVTGTPAVGCDADLDGSGDVGFGDILEIIAHWGFCPGCPQDLNGNNQVDFADILIVIGAWGACP